MNFNSSLPLQRLPLGIACIRLSNGEVISWNQYFQSMFSLDSMDKISYSDLIAEPREWESLKKAIRKTHQVEGITMLHRRKNGEDFWVACTACWEPSTDTMETILEEINDQRRNERLQSALFRIAEKSSLVDPLERLFPEIHSILSTLLYAKNFYIALCNFQEQLISFPYWADEFDPPPEQQPFRLGLTEYVLNTGKPLLVDDRQILAMADEGKIELIGTPSYSWLGVPLIYGLKAFGVMVVQSYSEKIRYGSQDRDLLIFVSRHIANSIWRKQSEEARKESEKRFRETLNFLPDMVLEMDLEGLLLYSNQAAVECTGYSEEELNSRFDFRRLFRMEDSLQVWKRLQEMIESGESIAEEVTVQRKDGSAFAAILRANAMRSGGVVSGTRCTVSDISFLKHVEESLHESEEKYRSLFEESRDAVYISNVEGSFIDINPAGLEMFGYQTKEELFSIDLVKDFYIDPHERFKFQKEIEQRGFVKDYELNFRRRDGKLIYASVTASAEYDGFGNILGYRGIIRDQTERRILEQQFLQAQKMESIGLLAGGISHDFNNILVGILGYASFLKMRMNPEDENFRYVEIIEKSASRAAELTSQLLAFGRGGKYDIKPVNLNNLIREAMKIIVPSFDKSIQIETELDESLTSVEVDAAQIQQVLINLCVNARDAMPKGGKLIISTQVEYISKNESRRNFDKRPGWFTVLTVADTGIGMDRLTVQRIFEPFFTTKEKGKGTGLGLSMVYGVIKNHGGFVLVDSIPKQGTVFKVYLPLSEKRELAEAKQEATLVGGPEGILIIDDEESIRSFCQDVLSGYGYKVFTAENGEEGLREYQEHPQEINLVMLDMIMPRLGGKETLQRLRAIDPKLPILFSTGYGENEDVKTIISMGVDGFIQKPYQVATLLTKVRDILDGRSPRRD